LRGEVYVMRFVAFPATEYDEVLSRYHAGQIVERWKNQRFEDHLCPRPQGASLIRLIRLVPWERGQRWFAHRSTIWPGW